MQNRQEIEKILKLVSHRMMNMKNTGIKEQFPVSLIDMECWEWPQGVGLYGLYRFYAVSGDEEVMDFLKGWYDRRICQGIHERNVNTTAPMLTLTYVYEKTGNAAYLDLIQKWAAWMMEEKGLLRTGDGCFQHMITGNPNEGEILIDTLFMAVLFLGRAGRILGRTDYVEEADYQILNHIKYLYNREEGLFYHGWNFDGGHNYGKVMWGRGNSWYTIGIMEYLEEAKPSKSLRSYYLSVYEGQADALKKYQNQDSGLWHTVITNSMTYEEVSASAGFLAGIMKGVRLGILPSDEYAALIQKGIRGVLSYVMEDGTVGGVSYGTPIGWNEAFYHEIICCPMTYGQAMVLLMLQELMEDFWYETEGIL